MPEGVFMRPKIQMQFFEKLNGLITNKKNVTEQDLWHWFFMQRVTKGVYSPII